MANKVQMSYYKDQFAKEKREIDIENYIGFVQHGANQDIVLKARAVKQKGDLEKYKKIKNTSIAVTGSAIMNEGAKTANNIKLLNGLIVIDVDNNINEDLKNDEYTYIYHKSFGGDGLCIFVRINPDKFEDSFDALADYYHKKYNVTIDQSCKNRNRLRYLSYDPDIFITDNPKPFKKIKTIERVKEQIADDSAAKKLDQTLKLLQVQAEGLVQGTGAYYENRKAILDASLNQELLNAEKEIQVTEDLEKRKEAIRKKYAALNKQLRQEEFNEVLGFIVKGFDAFKSVADAQLAVQDANKTVELENAKATIKDKEKLAIEQDKINEKYFYKQKRVSSCKPRIFQ